MGRNLATTPTRLPCRRCDDKVTSVTFDDAMRVATTIKADITPEAAKKLRARPTAASMKEGS